MSVDPQRPLDVIVVGAGAAGLFAAIHAGRAGARVLALDGARTLGAKILVAGGGRCNVTHHAVDEKAYAGSSPNAIKNVLRRYGVAETVKFFAEKQNGPAPIPTTVAEFRKVIADDLVSWKGLLDAAGLEPQ